MLETLLTAAVVLGIVFIFIVVFILLHKRRDNRKLAKYKVVLADVVWKNKLDLAEQETINHCVIGIDKINFILLYINFSNDKEEVILLDLWQIKDLKVTTEDNNVYEQRKGKSVLVDKHVAKLKLAVTLIDVESKVDLILYQDGDGMQDFLQIKKRAEYWLDLIAGMMEELPHPSQKSSHSSLENNKKVLSRYSLPENFKKSDYMKSQLF